MRIPSWAPRPVPTSSAVGVASPSAHGQAMISTATAAVKAKVAPAPLASQKPSVATDSAITIGTKTAEMRSASRCTGALPDCASVTSRPICARAVSAPTRVARTTRRPPALIVAPATASPGPTSTGTLSPVRQRRVDRGGAQLDHSVRGDPLARAHDEAIPDRELGDGDAALAAVDASSTDASLAPSSRRLREGGSGAALGAHLEVAAGQQEGGDHGGHLEVDVVGAGAGVDHEIEAHPHVRIARAEEEQGHHRPAPRGERADRDERVHGRRPVAQVGPGGAVEGPPAPEHDRGRELQGEPLPVVELEGRDHREQQHRQREQRPRRPAVAAAGRSGRAPPPRRRSRRAAGRRAP